MDDKDCGSVICYLNFLVVQEVLESSKYSTMKCDAVSPFLISKNKNNGPFWSRHFIFPVPFCSRDYTLGCSSFNN